MIFDDWFNGTEGYGLRSERFFEGLPALTEQEIQYLIMWLRTSYAVGLISGFEEGRKKKK